ncbi:TIGR01457 family HAD-type hydrolase [Paenibacillus sp. BC26]|uniref:TIGR01457 family HAD-type hydrolase n=1 Tax=Paenibacillus sp. BC26 TaxID=1881032 RepID=UPI0008E63E2F|nr:TIGR01457 family HAD-type hydrolase [Paenibacillus sp. BC26]SFS62074.1 4-nitrophenyl phosphatase [Paenibacillus sp. BC26]
MSVNTLRGLLIDLDGTMYHGGIMIPGADALIAALRRLDIPFLFVTNNSSATPEAFADRLSAMGIQTNPSEVCTSAQGAAAYIAERQPGARVHVIGEHGLRTALQDAGLLLVDEEPDIVVQGIDKQLTYDKVARAVTFIRGGASYILTNPDLLVPAEHGLVPGAGSIGAMLRAASGVEPIVIGKPSAILMDFALQRLGLHASETWMIGDNPATDIAAAQAADCPSILVLTGLATGDNYKELLAAAGCEATVIIDNLHTLQQFIGDQLASGQQSR